MEPRGKMMDIRNIFNLASDTTYPISDSFQCARLERKYRKSVRFATATATTAEETLDSIHPKETLMRFCVAYGATRVRPSSMLREEARCPAAVLRRLARRKGPSSGKGCERDDGLCETELYEHRRVYETIGNGNDPQRERFNRVSTVHAEA
ncbi:hypothetical protein WN48_07288 [Eufriesea mexicana]|uniref:Uncharacterized protein n=1 Tax=Eufriesea mexicana TaxID=516756 RepID=A0A310SRM1_9HYME|nr:hypothetical protein WN48_07288 [Eufriesea mexicana]